MFECFQRTGMFCETSVLLIFTVFVGVANCQNKSLDWWQKTVIYQIYPRSFLDTDGNGIGDLKGIIERLDHFNDAGIGCVWLSPIYKSPQVDFGYDISDYYKVDPIFGTLPDLKKLKKICQSMGIKVILDFVPNHTSNQHIWFQKSIKKIPPYTDYYVWKDPKGWINGIPIPPNNWMSLAINGSAWHFNTERRQFYLGQFLAEQPELNYHFPKVKEELKKVLRFYLNLGFNGFRTDAAGFLVEDARYPDEPVINATLAAENGLTYDNLRHIYTTNQPKTYEILSEYRDVLDDYSRKGGPTRVLLTEVYTDPKNTFKYYEITSFWQIRKIAQIPFNLFLIVNLNDFSNATDFDSTVKLWLENMPKQGWPNWQIGNHDRPRVPTRFEPSAVDALNMLVQLLPGTAITYQGEEIGMEDTVLRPDQIVDHIIPARDPERTPFQWDSTLNAGFSSNETGTWLPVNPNYYILNLAEQKKDPKSHYNIYKRLVKLRSTLVFQTGDFASCVVSEWIYSFRRSLGQQVYIIVMNLNNEQEYVNLITCYPNLPAKVKVAITSSNSEYNVGSQINTQGGVFPMRPKSAVVLQSISTK